MTGAVAAVLFDLDGTLAATMDPWDRCWSDYAARHGHTWTDTDRHRTHGHGDWADHLAADAVRAERWLRRLLTAAAPAVL